MLSDMRRKKIIQRTAIIVAALAVVVTIVVVVVMLLKDKGNDEPDVVVDNPQISSEPMEGGVPTTPTPEATPIEKDKTEGRALLGSELVSILGNMEEGKTYIVTSDDFSDPEKLLTTQEDMYRRYLIMEDGSVMYDANGNPLSLMCYGQVTEGTTLVYTAAGMYMAEGGLVNEDIVLDVHRVDENGSIKEETEPYVLQKSVNEWEGNTGESMGGITVDEASLYREIVVSDAAGNPIGYAYLPESAYTAATAKGSGREAATVTQAAETPAPEASE